MTKTQADILARAAKGRNGTVVTTTGYVYKKWFGRREGAAACALRDAGLLEHVKLDSGREVRQGRTIASFHDSTWRITEAGRAYLATASSASTQTLAPQASGRSGE